MLLLPALVASVAALVAAAVLGGAAIHAFNGPSSAAANTISVRVEGVGISVDPGTTFGELVRLERLRPKLGHLFDVRGRVIPGRDDVGAVLLNGVAAAPRTMLVSGDRVRVIDGNDRTEAVTVVRKRLTGRAVGDPQFSLSIARHEELISKGVISGEVMGVQYVPTGGVHTPKTVALTFDDGPSPTFTSRVLRVLRRFHVRATFFVIGGLAHRYPGLVRKEMRAGMIVGNHSWSHPESPAFADLQPVRIRSEISKTNEQLARFGIHTHLFRPPGGSYDPALIAMAKDEGLRVVLWDVDPRDWSGGATRKEIVRDVLASVKPGAIVDLHDGGGDQSATVAALPKIIKGIRRMGLRLVPLAPFGA